MATSKANFEKKVKDLEASLAKAASENSELKKSLEKQEKDWETRLATAESKLGESEEKLRNMTSRIELMSNPYGVRLITLALALLLMLDNLCVVITF